MKIKCLLTSLRPLIGPNKRIFGHVAHLGVKHKLGVWHKFGGDSISADLFSFYLVFKE